MSPKMHAHANERPFIRIFSTQNIDKFHSYLWQIDWSHIYNCENVDDAFEFMTSILANSVNECFPLIRCSRSKYKDKDWLNSKLKERIRTKNKLYQKFKKTKNVVDEGNYKKYKTSLDKDLLAHQKTYFHKILNCRHNTISNVRKILNSFCGFKNSAKQKKIESICTNIGEISNKVEITDVFNSYFSTSGNKLSNAIHHSCDDFASYL